MEVQGLVHLIGETETVGNNGFTKRLIVIETQEQYKQLIGIDFVKDKTSILDKYKIGESVKVSINIRGNEYKGKYYVNIQGWRIEAVESEVPSTEQFAPVAPNDDEGDGLPF